MEKVEVSTTETSQRDASVDSTVDQQSIPPIEPSTSSTEKSDLTENEKKVGQEEKETPEQEKKRIRKEKLARILTFVGLQVALFLAALDK